MSFDISNFVNRGSVRWIVLTVFLFGTIFGATAIAAAELDGTETEFYNETTPIANDDRPRGDCQRDQQLGRVRELLQDRRRLE